ncbi:MAG TPA: CPBP family intramembrane glutamic endopeptidase [Kofleriaceae bacterium]|nr:CPBP family intramembrane glutamic endopeptidase [Kofleriaceae bacterium]
MSGAAPGQVCGVCAAPLRPAARFCGRCGAEQGLMVPREQGVGEARPAARPAGRPLRGRGLVVAIAGYFAMLVPMLAMLARAGRPTAGDLATLEAAFGAVGLIGLVLLGRDALRGLVPRAPAAGVALAAAAVTAAIVGAVLLAAWAVPWLFLHADQAMRVRGMGLGLALVYVAVIPAVTEELLFRGAILGGLTDVLTDRTALIASSLVFAIAHLSVPSMVHLTALGLVLGWLRLRSGSLWPGVLLHAAYNAALLLAQR